MADYRCKNCGSTEVEHAMWVRVNETIHVPGHGEYGPIGEAFGTWNYDDNSYCNNCDEHGTLEDTDEKAPERQPGDDGLNRVCLAAIAAILDGREWNADSLDAIAGIVRNAGFQVRDVEEA